MALSFELQNFGVMYCFETIEKWKFDTKRVLIRTVDISF